MTGDLRAAADPTGLWPTLSTFEIGSRPSAFERKLADANGWTDAFAARVIAEYRRFLYLASVAKFEVTPSQAVDAAWHLHLEDQDHYRNALCGRVLGRALEHRAGTGNAEEEERFREQYRATLALYDSVFGRPPEDIWPPAGAAVPEQEDRPGLPLRWWIGAIGLAAAATLPFVAAQPSFGLALFLPIAVLAVILAVIVRGAGRQRKAKDSDGCGGGFFGGDGRSSDGDCGSSDGDCASCGGGCGGGGD